MNTGALPAGRPVGRRGRAKLLRQQQIAEAAARLLLTHSFEEITTKAVAAEAGMGEATLFRHIGSKHELLTIVYGDQLDAELNRIEEEDSRMVAQRRADTPTAAFFIERVLNAYRLRCAFYLINPANASLYLREGFKPGTESARHISQGDRTIRLVAQILREGQDVGTLTGIVDPLVVAQNCHGTYMHEIDRTPVRGFDPATIWERLEVRLRAQLEPLAAPRSQTS
ncbi:TetR/AcrR family transcriptional regulator [Agrococcus sp. BE272]|uniref:TetR/AcrR family transcriptional regulator n=1 Tax=Agrococcus sp. BE272 TaxID=2817727 RepID=UPI00285D39D0|nr:TetR/AcrR family transcriptional regulator [Agrococcus sp. BE272]MDR7233581.1 AcrR family transcriptional regulator [Agrococcus sp. BE272]